MRLLHIKGKDIDEYIVIDKIEKFVVFKIENTIRYTINLVVNGVPIPLTVNTDNPKKIIEGLLNTINTIDNEIIEYTINDLVKVVKQLDRQINNK